MAAGCSLAVWYNHLQHTSAAEILAHVLPAVKTTRTSKQRQSLCRHSRYKALTYKKPAALGLAYFQASMKRNPSLAKRFTNSRNLTISCCLYSIMGVLLLLRHLQLTAAIHSACQHTVQPQTVPTCHCCA